MDGMTLSKKSRHLMKSGRTILRSRRALAPHEWECMRHNTLCRNTRNMPSSRTRLSLYSTRSETSSMDLKPLAQMPSVLARGPYMLPQQYLKTTLIHRCERSPIKQRVLQKLLIKTSHRRDLGHPSTTWRTSAAARYVF